MADKSTPKKAATSSPKGSAAKKRAATAHKAASGGKKTTATGASAAKKSASGGKTSRGKGAAAGKKASPGRKAASAKKASSSTASAAKPSARERLADELVRLIPEIDAEGLLFLVRQANVLLHNKRVDELNAEMEKLNEDKLEAHKKAGTTARVGQTVREITVEIQRSADGKTYYMIIDSRKHFLTASEMAAVVKLCVKPERKSDALRFVYQYMRNERDEILMDHGVNSAKHPFFEALIDEVRRKFSVNQ